MLFVKVVCDIKNLLIGLKRNVKINGIIGHFNNHSFHFYNANIDYLCV